MTKCNELWVSDLIGQDYLSWEYRKVLLGCGTGRGKTVFSLGFYGKYLLRESKSVLYLCNRKSLRKQVEDDVKKYGVKEINCCSYQMLAKTLVKGDNIPEYDVYICDEAHFFLSDSDNRSASFNRDSLSSMLLNLFSSFSTCS